MAHLLVERACVCLRSAIQDKAVVHLNFKGDLREILDGLEAFRPLVDEAEMQLSQREIRLFTHTAYEIINMVDELQDTTAPAAAKTKSMLPRRAIRKDSMATKVNAIKQQLISLKEHFIFYEEFAITQKQERSTGEQVTVPSFEEASVYGRGADKQRIVAMLLSAASNMTQGHPRCTILPIFGFLGSGKTTLAQMVFNDINSHKQYNFRLWVHVSSELHFHRITECILRQVVVSGGEKEEIDDHGSKSDVMEMESTMKRLQELLNGKKVLLVLDDLWEEDLIQLELLKSMLTFLSDKMDVIVTTSNQAIARKICTVFQPYKLNPLSDDTCWEIFKKSIHFEEEEEEEFEKIGRNIASKCGGIPIAALAYASILRPERPTEWENTMKRNVWIYKTPRSGILFKFLNLSYRSMPPGLRLCLEYYNHIFPNGHNVVKDDLVQQWIALHLIEPSERSSATEIAEGYITRLLDMSYFQTVKSDQASGNYDKGATLFTMHNLAREFTSLIPNIYSIDLYIPYRLVLSSSNPKLDVGLRALRCIDCSNLGFDDSFSSKRLLRVLELKECPIHKLPDSICKLRHLRYLKIECPRLAELPESFGELTNLFHINLSGCSGLINLPVSIGDLINLSHVNLSRCHGLVELPQQLHKLGKLVHLDLSFWSCFAGIGKGLGGLTNLEHLNLSHPCCHLAQQRSHIQELKDGLSKLTSLRYLNLSMCLNPIFYYMSEEDSLQYIKSCVSGLSSLEHLDLSHHTFLFDLPESLGDLHKLHTLNLSGCIRLKRISEMKSLKFISLRNCRSLESCNFVVRVIDDDDAYNSSNIVQLEDVNCQELQIRCLEKVKSTEEVQRTRLAEKQKVEKLKLSWTLDSLRSLEDSALLGALTPPSNLQRLEVNGYNGTCLPEYLGDLTYLQELKIICCKQLICLPDNIQKLANLKNLCIFGCPELEKWCQLEENKKMLAHIPNKTNEEHASTSRPEIEEDGKSINEVEAA